MGADIHVLHALSKELTSNIHDLCCQNIKNICQEYNKIAGGFNNESDTAGANVADTEMPDINRDRDDKLTPESENQLNEAKDTCYSPIENAFETVRSDGEEINYQSIEDYPPNNITNYQSSEMPQTPPQGPRESFPTPLDSLETDCSLENNPKAISLDIIKNTDEYSYFQESQDFSSASLSINTPPDTHTVYNATKNRDLTREPSPLDDGYEVVSERLVIASPRDNDQGTIKYEQGPTPEEGRNPPGNTAPPKDHKKSVISLHIKPKRRDIIVRNKKGLGIAKSQGSYAQIYANRVSTTSSSDKTEDDTVNSVPWGNTKGLSEEGHIHKSLNCNSEGGSNEISSLLHCCALPPIHDPSSSNLTIQSAPADLYRLSFLILEEQRKLMGSNVVVPSLQNSFDQAALPQWNQSHTDGRFQSGMTTFSSPHHPYLVPCNQRVTNIGWKSPSETVLRFSHPFKEQFTQKSQKDGFKNSWNSSSSETYTARWEGDNQDSKVHNHPKTVSKPNRTGKRGPTNKRGGNFVGKHNYEIMEIVRKRHEEERKEVEEVRKRLSYKLRNAR